MVLCKFYNCIVVYCVVLYCNRRHLFISRFIKRRIFKRCFGIVWPDRGKKTLRRVARGYFWSRIYTWQIYNIDSLQQICGWLVGWLDGRIYAWTGNIVHWTFRDSRRLFCWLCVVARSLRTSHWWWNIFGFYRSRLDSYVFIFICIYQLIYRAPRCRNYRGAVSPRRWPKPSPVLIAPTHGGVARLSGPELPG